MTKNKTRIQQSTTIMVIIISLCSFLHTINVFANYTVQFSGKEKQLRKELNSTKGPNRLPIILQLMIESYGTARQIEYINLMTKEGEIYDSIKYVGQALTEKCCFYMNKGAHDTILKYAPKSMEINEQTNQSNYYYLSSSLYSYSLCMTNRFNEAISNGYKTYEKAIRDNDKMGLPASCEIMGNIYVQMHVYDEAMKYLYEEMNYYDKYPPENFSMKMQNYIDLLPLLINEKKYDEALKYCYKFDKELIKYVKYINYRWGIRVCRLFIRSARISAYSHIGYPQKAKSLLPFTEKDFEEIDEGTRNMCYFAEADYYNSIKQYDKAYASIKKVQNLKGLMPNNLNLFLDVLQQTNNTSEALTTLKNLYFKNDSTLNQRITEQLSQFNSLYQLGKLKDENMQIKQHETEMTIYLVTTIALLLLIIVCTITYYYRKEHHMNGMLKRTAADYKAALIKADESNRLKSKFLQNVSHELRTPLNAIVGFATYFSEKENANDEDKYIANLINTNSDQLLHIVGELMEMSKLETKAVTFASKPCNLSKLIPDIIISSDFSHKIHNGVKLNYEIPQDNEIIINTDEHHLRSIIMHLLDNSFKFTKEGFITLSLKRGKTASSNMIIVTDTGCGIEKEKQEEIFNNFTKANDFSKGFGLGLAICRIICENLNSKLEIDKNYEEGARFIIYVNEMKNE